MCGFGRNAGVRVLFALGALLVLAVSGCGPAPVAEPTAEPRELGAAGPAATAPPTATPDPTAIATSAVADAVTVAAEATGTPSPSATNQGSAETAAPTPTEPLAPQRTATPTPRPAATLDPDLPTPPVPIATPAPVFDKPDHVINIALVGNDGDYRQAGRTDAIVIASINTASKTATLLSLPRDLYVVIPGWTVERINLALPHGNGVDYPGGGIQLFKDTVLYNLGVELDYVVRIGFGGFQRLIDVLGGVDMVVTCPLEDWRLIAPDADPQVEENYERFKLEVGVYEMDADLALWYARSRRSTNDADRTRRQQQLLAAMLNRGVDAGLITQLPELWDLFQDEVETDLTLGALLRLAPIAGDLRENGIRHLSLNQALQSGDLLPDTNKWISLLQWDKAEPILGSLMSAPALGRASRAPLMVEVVAPSYQEFQLAAENLAWWGFIPTYTPLEGERPSNTELRYHGSSFKGSFDGLMSWIFHNRPIDLDPDPAAAADYTVTLGYAFNPCRNPLYYEP